jgi:uncharacterized protein (DUF2336 family)
VISVVRRLLGRAGIGVAIEYEDARDLARHPDMQVRRRLAGRADVRPEILYYLAGDKAAEVRRAIAANEATPSQADLILARDQDEAVRADLAGKIARIAPHLSAADQGKLRDIALEVLDILARDETVRVRRIIAETLKDVAQAPADVIRRLAQDADASVAAPVLQFSPLLSEDDLVAIIESASENMQAAASGGSIAAIARRAGLPLRVSDAVSASENVEAVAALLANPSAQIREETLDLLADKARPVPPWHAPFVRRPHLPRSTACKLSGFVADSLLSVLMKRPDLEPETLSEVAKVVRKRIAAGETLLAVEDAARDAQAAEDPGNTRLDRGLLREGGPRLAEYVQRLYAKGELNEDSLDEALSLGNSEFMSLALAYKAGVAPTVVGRIVAAHSAKGMTALAWKAGLTMRFAIKMQSRLAGVAPGDVIPAKYGTDYPLTPDEMTWLLSFFSE